MPLAPFTEVAHRHGATLNDVALTVVAGALRRTLGPGAAGLVPQVLVPVGDAVPGAAGNLFSFVVTGLPVGTSDPHAVLAEVHDRMELRKQSLQAAAVHSLFSLVDLVPVALLRRAAPAVLGRQPFVNLVVTNLPGSVVPLYLRGARLREVHPVITGIGNVACIVGVMSYCDQLGLSVTVDPDVVDDPDGLLAALDESAAEVAACAPTARRRTT